MELIPARNVEFSELFSEWKFLVTEQLVMTINCFLIYLIKLTSSLVFQLQFCDLFCLFWEAPEYKSFFFFFPSQAVFKTCFNLYLWKMNQGDVLCYALILYFIIF